MKSLDFTNALARLQAKSLRCLCTLREPFASRLMAFLRFLDRFCLRETRRCKRLSCVAALLRLAWIVYTDTQMKIT